MGGVGWLHEWLGALDGPQAHARGHCRVGQRIEVTGAAHIRITAAVGRTRRDMGRERPRSRRAVISAAEEKAEGTWAVDGEGGTHRYVTSSSRTVEK